MSAELKAVTKQNKTHKEKKNVAGALKIHSQHLICNYVQIHDQMTF